MLIELHFLWEEQKKGRFGEVISKSKKLMYGFPKFLSKIAYSHAICVLQTILYREIDGDSYWGIAIEKKSC